MSDVIKNPRRNLSADPPKLTPEWVNLGVEAIKAEDPSADFIMRSNNRSPTKRPSVGIHKNWYTEEATQEPILYDDIKIPGEQEESSEPSEAVKELPSSENSNFPNHNEYALYVRGELILCEKNIEVIEKVIEDMLFEQSLDITVDDIVLLKRISLKVGILAVV